jgi:4-hydroxybutyryl-CoA dehydratase/vinylacetyl-CoA-Delta-isomerase
VLKRLLRGRSPGDAEARARLLRLIENMTMGRNAVGYLTESLHGAGSPQAQRIQIERSRSGSRRRRASRAPSRALRRKGVTE